MTSKGRTDSSRIRGIMEDSNTHFARFCIPREDHVTFGPIRGSLYVFGRDWIRNMVRIIANDVAEQELKALSSGKPREGDTIATFRLGEVYCYLVSGL